MEQSNCFPVSALVHKIRLTQKQPDEYRRAARLLLASLHQTKFLPFSSCDQSLQSHRSLVICFSVKAREPSLKSEQVKASLQFLCLIFCCFLKRRLNRVNLVVISETGHWHTLFGRVRELLAFQTTFVLLLFWDFK